MKKRSIKVNYLLNLSYQILALITPLITTPYISRVLGAEGVGTYSYTYAMTTYFMVIATLGTTNYGQREIAYVQNDPYARSKVFFEVLLLRGLNVLLSLTAFGFIFWNSKYRLLYLMQSLYIVSIFFDISWFFQGIEQFGKIVFRNFLVKIVNVLFIFIFIKSSNDLPIYIFGLTFMVNIGCITMWFTLPKYLVKVPIKTLRPYKDYKIIIQLFIPQMATQIYTVLDKSMLGKILEDNTQVGLYEQAEKIVKICLTVITSLGIVMIPRIASSFASGDDNKVKQYMYKSFRFVWLLGTPMAVGLITTASNFVPWFLGEEFNGSIILVQIISILIFAIGISNIIGIQYFVPTKRQNFYTITVVIGLICNISLNLILIPIFYAKGAAIATVISEIVVAGTQMFFIRKNFKVTEIIKPSFKYGINAVFMGFVICTVKPYLESNFQSTAILILIGGVVYGAGLFAMRDSLTYEVVGQVLAKVKKRK